MLGRIGILSYLGLCLKTGESSWRWILAGLTCLEILISLACSIESKGLDLRSGLWLISLTSREIEREDRRLGLARLLLTRRRITRFI